MAERSLFWEYGTGGDSRAYSQQDLHDWFVRSVLNGTGNRGVLLGRWDALEVTGTSSPITVATGAAILYGMYYENDAPVTVSIPIPSAGTRTDLVVVRRNWAAKTCRVTRVAGTAGGAIAALTQSVGVTWDIPLAWIEMTAGGVLTITDAREYTEYGTLLADGSIDDETYFEAGAVTADKIPDRDRWDLKGAGQIDTDTDSLYGAEWVDSGGLYGAAYDHWRLASDVTDSLWVWFITPATLIEGGSVDFYIWSAPDVNGLGVGAENVHWDYDVYYGFNEEIPDWSTGSTLVDQQARLEDAIYADALLLDLTVDLGDAIGIRITRAGAQADDTYTAPVRLLGVEMRWTATS